MQLAEILNLYTKKEQEFLKKSKKNKKCYRTLLQRTETV